ncbi:MAG TPA: AprI/Inh family metalloprotease inhibitor [Phenylobacterium sp.]|jgi:uncharacterized low-complexity protein|nr:AprI/Inh family metalloprotease inhibitor [Phenylobacterium sp.]
MRALRIAAGLAGAALLAGASAAIAEDNQAGVPLTPAEAAGAWTIESAGHALCTVTLSASHTVKTSATCGEYLPVSPTGWQTTKDGMALTGSDGQPLIAFQRWSNSLFVAHRSSGVDIQLRRGGPGNIGQGLPG